MTESRIENLGQAVSYFNRKYLDNKGVIEAVRNGEYGPIAKRIYDVKSSKYYWVFFKKSWNEFFGIKFRKSGQKRGQTTNLKILQEAAGYGDTIVTVHPDGAIYACLAQDWLSYARQNGTIWIPKGEMNEEASVPDYMLKPANPHTAAVLERKEYGISDIAEMVRKQQQDKEKSSLDAYF